MNKNLNELLIIENINNWSFIKNEDNSEKDNILNDLIILNNFLPTDKIVFFESKIVSRISNFLESYSNGIDIYGNLIRDDSIYDSSYGITYCFWIINFVLNDNDLKAMIEPSIVDSFFQKVVFITDQYGYIEYPSKKFKSNFIKRLYLSKIKKMGKFENKNGLTSLEVDELNYSLLEQNSNDFVEFLKGILFSKLKTNETFNMTASRINELYYTEDNSLYVLIFSLIQDFEVSDDKEETIEKIYNFGDSSSLAEVIGLWYLDKNYSEKKLNDFIKIFLKKGNVNIYPDILKVLVNNNSNSINEFLKMVSNLIIEKNIFNITNEDKKSLIQSLIYFYINLKNGLEVIEKEPLKSFLSKNSFDDLWYDLENNGFYSNLFSYPSNYFNDNISSNTTNILKKNKSNNSPDAFIEKIYKFVLDIDKNNSFSNFEDFKYLYNNTKLIHKNMKKIENYDLQSSFLNNEGKSLKKLVVSFCESIMNAKKIINYITIDYNNFDKKIKNLINNKKLTNEEFYDIVINFLKMIDDKLSEFVTSDNDDRYSNLFLFLFLGPYFRFDKKQIDLVAKVKWFVSSFFIVDYNFELKFNTEKIFINLGKLVEISYRSNEKWKQNNTIFQSINYLNVLSNKKINENYFNPWIFKLSAIYFEPNTKIIFEQLKNVPNNNKFDMFWIFLFYSLNEMIPFDKMAKYLESVFGIDQLLNFFEKEIHNLLWKNTLQSGLSRREKEYSITFNEYYLTSGTYYAVFLYFVLKYFNNQNKETNLSKYRKILKEIKKFISSYDKNDNNYYAIGSHLFKLYIDNIIFFDEKNVINDNEESFLDLTTELKEIFKYLIFQKGYNNQFTDYWINDHELNMLNDIMFNKHQPFWSLGNDIKTKIVLKIYFLFFWIILYGKLGNDEILSNKRIKLFFTRGIWVLNKIYKLPNDEYQNLFYDEATRRTIIYLKRIYENDRSTFFKNLIDFNINKIKKDFKID